MSLFISFSGHGKSPDHKKPDLSRHHSSPSSNSSTQGDIGRELRSMAPTPEEDLFTRNQRSQIAEQLELSSKSLSEEGGEHMPQDRFALVDDWLQQNDSDLLDLVTKSLHEEGHASAGQTPFPDDSASIDHPNNERKKSEHRKNLFSLTSHRMDEEGGLSITAFWHDSTSPDDNAQPPQLGFFNRTVEQEQDSTPSSGRNTPKASFPNTLSRKKRPKVWP